MSRSVRGPDYSLRVFDKHPHMDAYRVGGSYTPYAIVATDKRFTDAELAAEYWRADSRSWIYESAGEFTTASLHQAHAATLRRFITNPSYDE